ncbi:hypothetical protein WJU70_001012 [Enterobacter cloacae]|uniref:amino acid adenylation protein n=1 Tax=Enterobacter cloacae TaxID=550 RepID=UPI0010A3BB55|nr:amino acid adenylation protein [Enterobacter cloacae]MCK7164602.1 hypothetical protein [Enterobacter cloacae]MCL8313807.1 hypothetical protein [Enterobacter cloacae subsp. cloacae]QCC92813.1 amino acid adenylation protein [Enterobacter cloacae]QCC97813.1 amino acid adenylation protein [Enterobacter cloacae]QCD10256.1 amino acid adenylation protein [Enterobacter cloacae]
MSEVHSSLSSLSPEVRQKLLAQLSQRAKNASESQELLENHPAEWLTLDRRPLLTLFAAGEEAPVDAVSITCLNERVVGNGFKLRDITHGICGDLPLLSNIRQLPEGRIATLTLPRTYGQIYAQSEDVVRLVEQSLVIAKSLGAKAVSLTGLIPSATRYGEAIRHREGMPVITTGHATTTSTVVLSLQKLLETSGRRMEDEEVSFIGLGSVGTAALNLMLKVLRHPRSLTLCDLYSRREVMEEVMRVIREEHGFRGMLRFVPSGQTCPDEIYDASLLIGATNVPNVVDVSRLRPGTLIVDDSDPHCFNAKKAIERLETHGDILFTEGGALRTPSTVQHRIFVPQALEWALQYPADDDNAHHITGCILSSLFSGKFGYPATLGMVEPEDALAHYQALTERGYQAANLHCGAWRVPAQAIATFRARFGKEV